MSSRSDLIDYFIHNPDDFVRSIRSKLSPFKNSADNICVFLDELERMGMLEIPINEETSSFIDSVIYYWFQEDAEKQNNKSQTEATTYAFPAYEIVQCGISDHDKWLSMWSERWRCAGESVCWNLALKDRFIAHKKSPIWKAIGDGAGGFTDTSGLPFPPFFLGSDCTRLGIDRSECRSLRLI